MRVLRVEEAIGMRLAHDYTCIDHVSKGAVKKRGDVIDAGDVEVLKKCGHFYVYVLEEDEKLEDTIHEEEAVLKIAELVKGENVSIKQMREAKIHLLSDVNGLLVVDADRLKYINSTGVFIVATRKTGSYVKKNNLIAVVDVIPLFVERELIKEIENKIDKPLIRVIESRKPSIGILVTGTEITLGLREDLATPIIRKKLDEYDCRLGEVLYTRDDLEEIKAKISYLINKHDAVIVTGGMSIDPTDFTPAAIKSIADEVLIYGVPIKPTTMSMIAYRGEKAIIGVSSGLIHYPEENILDIVLPWISCGVKIPRDFLVSLGEGGLLKSYIDRAE